MTICQSCGDDLGSRYHEVAHSPDVETASIEDLEAAAEIYDKLLIERMKAQGHGFDSCLCHGF